jgi:hypothetical protein
LPSPGAVFLIAGALGYALSVKNLYTMNVEFYTGVDERLEVPMILPPTPDLVDLEEPRFLIADDVADTGKTLALVKDFCQGKVAEVRCRGALREAVVGREVRVRLEADGQVDQLPVERQGAGGSARTGPSRTHSSGRWRRAGCESLPPAPTPSNRPSRHTVTSGARGFEPGQHVGHVIVRVGLRQTG